MRLPEAMTSLLDEGGALAEKMPSFEPREGQKQMLADVADAFSENKTALLEAGTGTGKSVAYLIPALFAALDSKQTTVISTHTISLQQQLINKDIPFLLEVLGFEVKACLVKGMRNYLCLRKLEDAIQDNPTEELEAIEAFSQEAKEASRSDLPFTPTKESWEQVNAQKESCTFVKCPHFKNCFFFKARKQSEDARILVVNHHLLCADLAVREKCEDTCILPPYHNIIIDEAHHLENVASEYFSIKTSRFAFQLLLGRLISDKKSGKLLALAKMVTDEKLQSKLTFDIPCDKKVLLESVHALFDALAHLLIDSGEEKCRLLPKHTENSVWKENVQPMTKGLLIKIKGFVSTLEGLAKEITDPALHKKCEGILADIVGICKQIQRQIEALSEFVFGQEDLNKVRWIERSPRNISVTEAKLDISEDLKQALFEKFETVVLSSATLTTNQSFSFIQKKLGIDNNPLTKIYDSPFDFASQTKLLVPLDLLAPDHPRFVEEAAKVIEKALQASQGGAFVLFTSYAMLSKCKECLAKKLEQKKMPLFCQGEESFSQLLLKFKKSPHSVLFGTDSFWEGVDVVGDALRCVVLVKLPFKVPTEPLLKARAEKIEKEGRSSFFEEALPAAVIKFKQGFGRLIRNQNDRGAIICLDSRLAKKGYGKQFLQSLPPCPTLFDTTEKVVEELNAFYATSVAAGSSAAFKSLSTESVIQASDQTLSAVSSMSKRV